MEAKKILIAGEFVSGKGRFEVRAPYDNGLIAEVFSADHDRAAAVLAAAEKAGEEMRDTGRGQLRDGLQRVSRGIEKRLEEFSVLIARESGKPIYLARVEAERAAATFRFAAAEAERFTGEVIPVDVNESARGYSGITSFSPKGTIVGITPFNYPLNLVAHKVAPALASRNAIIIKPSEKTPLSSLLLGELFLDCGLPAGALQVVPMELDVLANLLGNERVKMISFTGSDKVGWMLKERYPRKSVALELGGNAPVIVDETVDLIDAADRITAGAFGYSGQVCISVQRIIVQSGIESELSGMLIERAGAMKSGDPLDDQTRISSMISKQAAQNAIETVRESVALGAEVLCGGEADGSFIAPTLVRNVDPEMRIVRDEIFAPVATIEPFDSFESAVDLANHSRFGLQAGVFTTDSKRAGYAAKNLEYGGVIINDVPTFRVDNMPYGGIKDSGVGREGVRYAMEDMCDLKLIVSR